ncbi:hypothetical protein DFH09DRAFT_1413999 [Mycena vulgaris]|nr:hypothetical protein DFH09DRAFT_1413999 [Mycena vulgaris]
MSLSIQGLPIQSVTFAAISRTLLSGSLVSRLPAPRDSAHLFTSTAGTIYFNTSLYHRRSLDLTYRIPGRPLALQASRNPPTPAALHSVDIRKPFHKPDASKPEIEPEPEPDTHRETYHTFSPPSLPYRGRPSPPVASIPPPSSTPIHGVSPSSLLDPLSTASSSTPRLRPILPYVAPSDALFTLLLSSAPEMNLFTACSTSLSALLKTHHTCPPDAFARRLHMAFAALSLLISASEMSLPDTFITVIATSLGLSPDESASRQLVLGSLSARRASLLSAYSDRVPSLSVFNQLEDLPRGLLYRPSNAYPEAGLPIAKFKAIASPAGAARCLFTSTAGTCGPFSFPLICSQSFAATHDVILGYDWVASFRDCLLHSGLRLPGSFDSWAFFSSSSVPSTSVLRFNSQALFTSGPASTFRGCPWVIACVQSKTLGLGDSLSSPTEIYSIRVLNRATPRTHLHFARDVETLVDVMVSEYSDRTVIAHEWAAPGPDGSFSTGVIKIRCGTVTTVSVVFLLTWVSWAEVHADEYFSSH